MTYDNSFGSRIKCTEKEKQHSLLLLHEILEQSKKARSAGFLVLGEDTNSITNNFLKDSIRLIGRGYDYEAIERILDIRIAVRNAEGIHLLEMAMIKEGVLSILRSDPISLTEEILFSFLGVSIYKNYLKEKDNNFSEYLNHISKTERTARSECGFWLLKASDNEISFLLKVLEWETLGVLMKMETDAVRYRIYNNLGNEAAKLFKEQLTGIKIPDAKTINDAETKFRAITEKISINQRDFQNSESFENPAFNVTT